jgi:hypothetical protein
MLSITALGITQPSVEWVQSSLSPAIKRVELSNRLRLVSRSRKRLSIQFCSSYVFMKKKEIVCITSKPDNPLLFDAYEITALYFLLFSIPQRGCISWIPSMILRGQIYILFYFSQIYNLLYNGAISKYVIRKHLCGAIIQWWFSYIYSALCCACLYSSASLWSCKSEGHCSFSLRLTFNGLQKKKKIAHTECCIMLTANSAKCQPEISEKHFPTITE